ncbi:hypothetical protein QWY97_18130, partial [Vibrio cortegadensis]|uniref:hypothetical protein n=1 Tax=Vibrio cortegadensis TaxID=1328770 RepID=UPI0025B54669
SHHLIELPNRRTLVAAKVWVSPYPIGVPIIHTNNLRVTPNACRFHSDLNFVFTAQWFSLGVIALSHLNWALCT